MTIEQTAAKLERKLLRRTPLTAGELADRAGFSSGRAIARALGYLVSHGKAVMHHGRKPTYLKPAF